MATASSGEGLFGALPRIPLGFGPEEGLGVSTTAFEVASGPGGGASLLRDASAAVRQRLTQITIDDTDDDALLKVVSDDATKQR